MNYKKLVGLLAVSTLALAACDTDEETTEPETGEVDTGEDENGTEEETEGSSSSDLINQASEQAGDAFPEYGLTINSGSWTEDGYLVASEAGTATVTAAILTDQEEYFVYVLQDGEVVEKHEAPDSVEFSADEPAEDTTYVFGITPDDLGDEGDTVDTEDFYRYENVIITPEPEDAEEEEE